MQGVTKGFLLAACMLAVPAVSAMEPEEISCGSKFDTTEKINQCFADATAQSERDIETVKQGLLQALAVARSKLQTAEGAVIRAADEDIEKSQQTWRAYRVANCGYYETVYTPISTPGMEKLVCELRMTRQRVRELQGEQQFWAYKFRDNEIQAPESAAPIAP